MSKERWQQIWKLFEEALRRPEEEHAAFLEQACKGDAALRLEVGSLLKAHQVHGPMDVLEDALKGTGQVQLHLQGQKVGRFQVEEKLGEGGMGVVYKALDPRLRRTVVLKFLSPHLGADSQAKERFLIEAQATAALEHPNICTIHEIGETADERLFIAMSYYEGKTLKQKIAQGLLPVQETLALVTQIARGLAHAHDQGVVHRDIKPANILVTNDGIIKIVDFGLAKLGGMNLTQTGMMMGTVGYMSPEQAQSMMVDHRTDIWSLGVVLYEMLGGQQPFRGDYPPAVIYSIIYEDPLPLQAARPDIPEALEAVVSRMIAKDPNARYPDMKAVLHDLATITAGGTVQAKPVRQREPSLVVLPFLNLSSDPENEYFSDGLAEELINRLIMVQGLQVIARTSAFSLKGTTLGVREIGRQLKVDTVLEGSVRRVSNRVRITVQLINVANGRPLWSERYDRMMDDVFAIQDEIALAIVDKLKVELLGDERKALVKRYTDNQEAYHLYLKGRYFWDRRYEGGINKGRSFFRQAIEEEPTYALAHAGLSDAYNLLAFWGYMSPAEALPKAKAAADQAMLLDDQLAEAHKAQAFSKLLSEGDWEAATQGFKQALALNPNYASAYQWYGCMYFMPVRQFEEALASCLRAVALDPLSIVFGGTVAIVLYMAHRYDEAIAYMLKALDVHPDHINAMVFLGLNYTTTGQHEEAVTVLEKGLALEESAFTLGSLGYAYAVAGEEKAARAQLEQLTALAKERYIPFFNRAMVYAGLDEQEKALDLLEHALEAREPLLIWLNVFPIFEPLRGDPRFKKMICKIGLKP